MTLHTELCTSPINSEALLCTPMHCVLDSADCAMLYCPLYLCPCVMIHDTRSGNWSCDRSGDLSPTFSKICLCLFTYVWSLDLFWKLYIVPTLRELTSLSFNIDYDTPLLSFIVWGRPSDWGASLYAEPKSALGSHIWTMGELIITPCMCCPFVYLFVCLSLFLGIMCCLPCLFISPFRLFPLLVWLHPLYEKGPWQKIEK